MEKGDKTETNAAATLRVMRTIIIADGFVSARWMWQIDNEDPNEVKEWFNQRMENMENICVRFEKYLHKKEEKEYGVCIIKGLEGYPELFGSRLISFELDKMSQRNDEDDMEGLISAFQRLKEVKEDVRNHVEAYFELAYRVKRLEIAKNKGQAGSSGTAKSSKK